MCFSRFGLYQTVLISVEPQSLHSGGIYPIPGHHDVAKTSQKEIVRKPQDSILEKQFRMVFAVFFTGCFLLTHMDGGGGPVLVMHRTGVLRRCWQKLQMPKTSLSSSLRRPWDVQGNGV